MNIFESLKKYNKKWEPASERSFTEEEVNAVSRAVVVESNYGNSVRFDLVSGGCSFIPVANDSSLGVGEEVDMRTVKVVKLVKDGEQPINRIR